MNAADIDTLFKTLAEVAEKEFQDIVTFTSRLDEKLRIFLVDKSYVDIWFSRKLRGRYTYHWEHTHIRGKIHRHDNIPHHKWSPIKTFPKHFHNDDEANVQESTIDDDPEIGLRGFLEFIRQKLKDYGVI